MRSGWSLGSATNRPVRPSSPEQSTPAIMRATMGQLPNDADDPPPPLPFHGRARMTGGLVRGAAFVALCTGLLWLAACSSPEAPPPPAEVRAHVLRLLPTRVADRPGWAADVQVAFDALELKPSTQNLCAVLAVAEQESNYTVDPVVPGLGRIALAELDRRASEHGVPAFLMHAALKFTSPDGHSYEERLAAARTEQDLSRIYEDFIGTVPLGRRLLAGGNPVRTGGPMQVSIAFAEEFSRR